MKSFIEKKPAVAGESLHDLLEKHFIFSFLIPLILWFTPFQFAIFSVALCFSRFIQNVCDKTN